MNRNDSTRTNAARTRTRTRQAQRAAKYAGTGRNLNVEQLAATLHREQAERAEFLADMAAGRVVDVSTPRRAAWAAQYDAAEAAADAAADRMAEHWTNEFASFAPAYV